jgi:hypothetical protein
MSIIVLRRALLLLVCTGWSLIAGPVSVPTSPAPSAHASATGSHRVRWTGNPNSAEDEYTLESAEGASGRRAQRTSVGIRRRQGTLHAAGIADSPVALSGAEQIRARIEIRRDRMHAEEHLRAAETTVPMFLASTQDQIRERIRTRRDQLRVASQADRMRTRIEAKRDQMRPEEVSRMAEAAIPTIVASTQDQIRKRISTRRERMRAMNAGQ